MDDTPPELLCLIFTACRPISPSSPGSKSFPLNLAHVCSLWRRLIFQMPEIWTCIRIEASERVHPVTRRRILDVRQEQMELWFSNAQDRPLALYLDLARVEPLTGNRVDGGWSSFLRFALIERAQSLRALHIVMGNPSDYEALVELGPAAFPVLEEIRLQSKWGPEGFMYLGHGDITNLTRAPRLTRVLMNEGMSSKWFHNFPHHQLTHLKMSYTKSLYNVLGSAPNLQKLHLYLEIGSVHQTTQNWGEVLTMEHLQHLTINVYRLLDQSIFSSIRLPSLTHLHLYSRREYSRPFNWWPPSQSIHDHFVNQLKNLCTLSIVDLFGLSQLRFIELLQSVRKLKTLILDVKCFINPRVLRALNDSKDGIPTLVPRLKELHVLLERDEPYLNEASGVETMRLIARMISTRCSMSPKLEKVVFWTKGPLHWQPGHIRWRQAEATLKNELEKISGLQSRVVSVPDRLDWHSWWTETSAIEEDIRKFDNIIPVQVERPVSEAWDTGSSSQDTTLMDDIPPELLCLIFAACRPISPSSPDSKSFPLNLAHVCSLWRRLIFQMPEMWACIRIEASERIHAATRRRILDVRQEEMELWFSNAKDRPLALYIDLAMVEPLPGKTVDGRWTRFVQFAFIERAQSLLALHLVFSNPNHYEALFKLGSTAFPVLEEIRLQYKRGSRTSIYQGHGDITSLTCAPKLTRLMLNEGMSTEWFDNSPHHQLTHLQMLYKRPLYNILSSAPNLQRLRLYLEIGRVHQPTQNWGEVLTMEHLQHLTISVHHSLDQSIFSRIRLPSLAHLHIYSQGGYYNSGFSWSAPTKSIHDHFISQLKRLRTLSILGSSLSHQGFTELLGSVRRLRTLITDMKSFVHPLFFRALSLSNSKDGIPKLVPHLKELHVFLERDKWELNEAVGVETMRSIARMISARCSMSSKLEKVVFWTKGPDEWEAGYFKWKDAEVTLKTELKKIRGLDSRVVCVRDRLDWHNWWTEISAIEED
ncbi:hypothetical protein BJ165DRAFT_1401290 [Panaeolus papilionaceus]|nr:hypothetical protein BJ165DRAFT_1401290 [Panaeolus papilionaceus]